MPTAELNFGEGCLIRTRSTLLESSTAIYSPCERYRYHLSRSWGGGPTVAFIGLNPSTATEQVNDPTVTRCIGYAKRWGYDGFTMLNAYAFRSTDPKGLLTIDDPAGPECNRYLAAGIRSASMVICCWGANCTPKRHQELIKLIGGSGKAHHLGLTKGGFPKHPLYLRGDLVPVKWDLNQTSH